MVINTERLIIRTFAQEDAAGFYQLNADPEVMRYTGDVAFESIEAARQFITDYKAYAQYGYGRWTVLRKADQAYIGWCGLKYSRKRGETDIGFRLMRQYWGKGYATEAAYACLEYGFETLKLNRIIGCAMSENAASIRVLKKLNMQYERTFEEDGHQWVQYAIYQSSENS